MTVCASATIAILIISCRLTAPCGYSHYDCLRKRTRRNAHYIMIRTYGAFRCCRNYHDPIRRSPIMQACWLPCAHYIMSPVRYNVEFSTFSMTYCILLYIYHIIKYITYTFHKKGPLKHEDSLSLPYLFNTISPKRSIINIVLSFVKKISFS